MTAYLVYKIGAERHFTGFEAGRLSVWNQLLCRRLVRLRCRRTPLSHDSSLSEGYTDSPEEFRQHVGLTLGVHVQGVDANLVRDVRHERAR